jgi:hypothetical protein
MYFLLQDLLDANPRTRVFNQSWFFLLLQFHDIGKVESFKYCITRSSWSSSKRKHYNNTSSKRKPHTNTKHNQRFFSPLPNDLLPPPPPLNPRELPKEDCGGLSFQPSYPLAEDPPNPPPLPLLPKPFVPPFVSDCKSFPRPKPLSFVPPSALLKQNKLSRRRLQTKYEIIITCQNLVTTSYKHELYQ